MRWALSIISWSKLRCTMWLTYQASASTQASQTAASASVRSRASWSASRGGRPGFSRRPSSMLGHQAVAGAAHGQDAFAPELAAQPADEDFQRVAVGLGVEAVERIEQMLARVQAPRMDREHAQQRPFLGREQQGAACIAHHLDRKSTRLISSHLVISYAVF